VSQQSPSPLVSIIIPTYNRAHIVLRAVASALFQTHRNIEVLVVDDGSTDNTLEVLAELADPRLRVLTQENQGVSVARNNGLANAAGDYVAFCDSDDWLFRYIIAAFVDHALKNPDVDAFYANPIYSDCFTWLVPFEPEQLSWAFCIQVGSFFLKKSKAIDFAEDLNNCEDWFYVLKLLKAGVKFQKMPLLSVLVDRYQNDHLHTGFNERDNKSLDYRAIVSKILSEDKEEAKVLVVIKVDDYSKIMNTIFIAVNSLRIFLKEAFKVVIVSSQNEKQEAAFENYLDVVNESELSGYLQANDQVKTVFSLKPNYVLYRDLTLPTFQENTIYSPCIYDQEAIEETVLYPCNGWGVFPFLIKEIKATKGSKDDVIYFCTKNTFEKILNGEEQVSSDVMAASLAFFETDKLI